jgi:hypothetical protein
MKSPESISVSPLRWAIIATLPFVAVSAYLVLSRWPNYKFTTFSDYFALLVSVGLFILAVSRLPLTRKRKIIIAAFGTPALLFCVALYSFAFIAIVFKDGL